MDIKTHRFTQVQNQDLVMSTKAASRAMAHQGEWDEYFGPNITSLFLMLRSWNRYTCKCMGKGSKKNVSNSSFMDMASSSIQNKKNERKVQKEEVCLKRMICQRI